MHQSTSWRLPPVAVAVGLLIALLLAGGGGLAIGRATADSPTTTVAHNSTLPPVTRGTLTAPHGPVAMKGDLPVGFTDDKAGALSFVAVAGEALIDYVQIRRTTPGSTWIATYTVGQLSDQSLQRIYDWDPLRFSTKVTDRPTELAPQTRALSVSQLVPVGYRVLSFSPTTAHVQVWFNGVGWTQGSNSPNTVVNRSADVQLVWRSGDWKITSYTNPSGQSWDGPGLDDPNSAGFVPWPGGQFTFVTG